MSLNEESKEMFSIFKDLETDVFDVLFKNYEELKNLDTNLYPKKKKIFLKFILNSMIKIKRI